MKKFCSIFVLMFLTVLFMSALYAQDYASGWEKKTLTKLDGTSENPALTMFKKKHHAVWSYRDQNYNGWLYYNRSLNSGKSWKKNTKLFTFKMGEATSGPAIAVWKKFVHVIFQHSIYPNYDIVYLRSTNNGKKWKKSVILATNNQVNTYPQIAAVSKVVHVIWVQERPNSSGDQIGGICDVFYKKSMNNGATWGNTKNLSVTANKSIAPQIVVNKSNIHIVWNDWVRKGNNVVSSKIFYIKSTNNGNTWSSAKMINSQDAGMQEGGRFDSFAKITVNPILRTRLICFTRLRDLSPPGQGDNAAKSETCWAVDSGSGFGPVRTLSASPAGYFLEYMYPLDNQTLFTVWQNPDNKSLQSARYNMATGARQGGFSQIKVFNKDGFPSYKFYFLNNMIWGILSESIQQPDYSMKSTLDIVKHALTGF